MKIKKSLLNQKNIKVAVGLVYLIIVSLFLYMIFLKFNYEDFTNYKFIQANRDYFVSFKEKNILLISLLLIFSTIIWVILLGFGTPVALISGFIFGKWYGAFLAIVSLSIGASILYITSVYFLKNLIKKIFFEKFKYLEKKFKNHELLVMIIFRIIGMVPFSIANILPALFNIKLRNYFLGTFIGIAPSVFIIASLGNGFDSFFSLNEQMPSLIAIIKFPEIYFPLIGFFFLLITVFFIKKKF